MVKELIYQYLNSSYVLHADNEELLFSSPLDYFESYLGYYKNLNEETLLFHSVFGFFIFNEKKYRHPHQAVRINYFGNEVGINLNVCEKMLNNLMKINFNLNEFESFNSLIEYLTKNKIRGFGTLAIYDLALRLSYNRNILPAKIYLHGGTKKGYLNLCKSINVDCLVQDAISVKSLPEEMQKIQPYILEDFLCVYKSNLNF